MRLTCETEGCGQTATGTWKIGAGRPTVCCDDCNPSAKPDLPVGFTYIRWFPLPETPPDWLLDYVTPEVLAREYGRP